MHTNHGSSAQTKDVRPLVEPHGSGEGQYVLYSSCGGRSSSQYDGSPAGIPYVNLDWGDDGHIVALGWPGQWGMQIGLDDDGDAALQGGMTSLDGRLTPGELPANATIDDLGTADLYLEAGERIQTPQVVVLAWKGEDWIDGQRQDADDRRHHDRAACPSLCDVAQLPAALAIVRAGSGRR